MGATTYEWILRHGAEATAEVGSPWPYTQPCWVFTHRDHEAIAGADLRFTAEDVREVHAAMVEAAVVAHGRVDILVNNAGVRIRRPFGDFSADDVDQVMAVNLRAPMLAAQAAAADMRTRGRGRIINIASQLGSVTDTGAALYGTSKAALLYLTRAMAVELAGSGVVVNAVSPGTTATDYILETMTGDRLASRIEKIPAGRLGRPDEIAQAVVFLATTPATFLLGHNLIVDGGETAS